MKWLLLERRENEMTATGKQRKWDDCFWKAEKDIGCKFDALLVSSSFHSPKIGLIRVFLSRSSHFSFSLFRFSLSSFSRSSYFSSCSFVPSSIWQTNWGSEGKRSWGEKTRINLRQFFLISILFLQSFSHSFRTLSFLFYSLTWNPWDKKWWRLTTLWSTL